MNVVATMDFVPGKINEDAIGEMKGAMVKMAFTNTAEDVKVEDITTFKYFDYNRSNGAPISHAQASIGYQARFDIKLLSLQNKKTK